MFWKPAQKCSGGFKSRLAVAFWVALFVVFVGPGLLQLDGSQALAKKKGKKICNATARAAAKACQHEVADDYSIAVGNCINLSDRDERSECLQDAKADFKDDKGECRDQKEARLEVCGELGQAAYDPQLDPDAFVSDPTQIGGDVTANPYFPLVPGTLWTYYNTNGETNTVEVTGDTKDIEYPADSQDIYTCIVVHDQVMVEGEVTEDTLDYYAQDTDGNVWYFGELSRQFDDDGDLVDLEGSWKAGRDYAKPGIIMEADPQAGDIYRQEFLLGDAEDMGQVISTTAEAPEDVRPLIFPCTVGGVGVCLQTSDFSAMEPDVEASKYYAPGVGVVLEDEINDEGVRELNELVSVTTTP